MKLTKTAKTFNLGDTSFRRETLIDDYKTLLPFLLETNAKFKVWNNDAQADFYHSVLTESDLFERNDTEDFAKRGRTLTNPLVKVGLTNDKRTLSNVALNWLNSSITPLDKVEKTLGLDINNVLFLRQLLKLRVYKGDGIHYFYPFRVALYLISNYENIPQQDFLTIIHLIQPDFTEIKIKEILNNYHLVVQNTEIFSEFLDSNFPDGKSYADVETLFSDDILNKELFKQIFVNRKTQSSQELYYDFVSILRDFKRNKSQSSLNRLLKISNNAQIKKAFGFGKLPFIKKTNVDEFLQANEDNVLLSSNDKDIYSQFVLSKKDDIVREYSDMTKRTFNLTGLINFSNGLVNAVNQDVVKIIFSDITLSGSGNYNDYEQDLDYIFYQDISLMQVLNIDSENILESLKNIFKLTDVANIEDAVINQKETKFRDFIKTEFPKEKILEILPLFSNRDDEKIQEQVSKSATVPTIFEYIIAIAWYYISSENFYITKSLNLTLDGNMLPLSHAAGGEGDIVIQYIEKTVMLEVTLMNSQAQKRGEWEPVLRHATNLTVDESPRDVTTLFIADQLDENTINIWRAIAGVPLKSSNKDEYAKLVKVFPLTISNVIEILGKKYNDQKLLESINHSYVEYAQNFNNNWREEILWES